MENSKCILVETFCGGHGLNLFQGIFAQESWSRKLVYDFFSDFIDNNKNMTRKQKAD
jgi:hypothetical protein